MAANGAAPGWLWVQEEGCILVVDPSGGAAHRLTGMEEALWDWLQSGHTAAESVALLQAAFDLPEPEARRMLERTILKWRGLGMAEGAEPTDG